MPTVFVDVRRCNTYNVIWMPGYAKYECHIVTLMLKTRAMPALDAARVWGRYVGSRQCM